MIVGGSVGEGSPRPTVVVGDVLVVLTVVVVGGVVVVVVVVVVVTVVVVVATLQLQGFIIQGQPATIQRSEPQSLQRVQQSVRSTTQSVQPFAVRLPTWQYGHNLPVAVTMVVVVGGVVVAAGETGADGYVTPSTSDLSTSINTSHVAIHGGSYSLARLYV